MFLQSDIEAGAEKFLRFLFNYIIQDLWILHSNFIIYLLKRLRQGVIKYEKFSYVRVNKIYWWKIMNTLGKITDYSMNRFSLLIF